MPDYPNDPIKKEPGSYKAFLTTKILCGLFLCFAHEQADTWYLALILTFGSPHHAEPWLAIIRGFLRASAEQWRASFST